MKEIYFDNSATTKPSQAVIDIVVKTMAEDYGNPSSMHQKGVDAEKYVKHASEIIAGILKVKPDEIIYTSGGTEADNFALIGTALANKRRGNTILISDMEHPAVAETARFLAKEGFNVQKIPVHADGALDLDALAELLTDDVILVSTMYVNNEIGSVVPVAEVAKLVHAKAPLALYHVDAVQAFGKYRIYPKESGIDLMSVSGHKLHGPKGSGFLYIRHDAHIVPHIYGGGQQRALRSGTDNVPGIAGLGVACEEAYTDFDAKIAHLRSLREQLISGLLELPDVVIHGMPGEAGAPHIVSAAFKGVGSEVLLHALEDRGICISAGSACSTHKRSASPTLTAIEAPKEEVTSTVRFSFSEYNTAEEVEYALTAIRAILPLLRRYRAH